MKQFVIGVALAAFVSSSAFAQTSAPVSAPVAKHHHHYKKHHHEVKRHQENGVKAAEETPDTLAPAADLYRH
jgi:Spy/CpxP family protein refolding chaperone